MRPADLQLEDRMAKTPEAAYDLLMAIWEYALPQAKRERDEMQQIIDSEGGVQIGCMGLVVLCREAA